MQSYSSITNCCNIVLFIPKHCLSHLWFKVHVYLCVCIYRSVCLNQIFLLSLRVLWFTWSQPVPQHRGERWAATAELQLSWRCSFSSFGSGYFHHKGKWFRKWRDAVPRCLGEADTCISDIFFWSMETVLILSALRWSTETLSPKACSLPGQPNRAFCLFYLYSQFVCLHSTDIAGLSISPGNTICLNSGDYSNAPMTTSGGHFWKYSSCSFHLIV